MAEQKVIVETHHMLSEEKYGAQRNQWSEHFEALKNRESS
jgi:hypothetical protein